MTQVPAYILAGGKSRRYGANKALIRIGNEELVVRLARMLGQSCSSISVVGECADQYDHLGLRTIGDRRDACGPLAGLESALLDAGSSTDWIFVTACDWLALQSSWIETLEDHIHAAADVIAFVDTRAQPLCSLYHRRTLGIVQELLDQRSYSLEALFQRLRVEEVPAPHDWHKAMPFNTPQELSQHLTRLYRGGSDASETRL